MRHSTATTRSWPLTPSTPPIRTVRTPGRFWPSRTETRACDGRAPSWSSTWRVMDSLWSHRTTRATPSSTTTGGCQRSLRRPRHYRCGRLAVRYGPDLVPGSATAWMRPTASRSAVTHLATRSPRSAAHRSRCDRGLCDRRRLALRRVRRADGERPRRRHGRLQRPGSGPRFPGSRGLRLLGGGWMPSAFPSSCWCRVGQCDDHGRAGGAPRRPRQR